MLIRYINIILIFLTFFSCIEKNSSAKVKKNTLAGRWYTADSSELSKQIDTLLRKENVKSSYSDPLLFILPHAGYQYSGNTAATGYRILKDALNNQISPNLIVLLGPSHYKSYSGCAVLLTDYFESPLGRVKNNIGIAKKLISKGFKNDLEAFNQEHSIEIHLPFLQRIFGNKIENTIQILPILTGELSNKSARQAAEKIASTVSGTRPVFIISSDFTHYGPAFNYTPFRNNKMLKNEIKKLDFGAIDFILKKDLQGFSDYLNKTGATICGRNAIKIALALPVNHFKSYNIHYDTSGNITGDYTNSVSYSSILFCGSLNIPGTQKAGNLTQQEKNFLLKTARNNIISWLTKNREIRIPAKDIPVKCNLKRGAFVTLKKHGELRGCIGYVIGHKSLIRTVLENSYNAAFRDPRFMPLKPDEIDDIRIEISVLTEPELIESVNMIQAGRHGLIVDDGIRTGLLLPQVATEQDWDAETFLSHTCLKAGLSSDAWQHGNLKIYTFEAIVFSEAER